MVLGVVFNLRQYIIDSSPTRTQAEDVVDDAASQTSSASMSVFGTVAGVVRSSAVRQRLRLRHRDGTELSTLRRELERYCSVVDAEAGKQHCKQKRSCLVVCGEACH